MDWFGWIGLGWWREPLLRCSHFHSFSLNGWQIEELDKKPILVHGFHPEMVIMVS